MPLLAHSRRVIYGPIRSVPKQTYSGSRVCPVTIFYTIKDIISPQKFFNLARYDFPDEAWELISPMLPSERGSSRVGLPYFAHRHIMNGIFWVLCSDTPWRDLPERYGQWKTIYNRVNWWSKTGIMNSIFNKLLQILDEQSLINWDVIALDGSNVRALKAAAGAKKNIPMNSRTMSWVALAATLEQKPIWRQMAHDYR